LGPAGAIDDDAVIQFHRVGDALFDGDRFVAVDVFLADGIEAVSRHGQTELTNGTEWPIPPALFGQVKIDRGPTRPHGGVRIGAVPRQTRRL
jgi:hypothetical protein